jgi:hypothetical protein
MHPIHQQHLLVELVASRGDHLVEFVPFTQLFQFGIGPRIKPKPLRIVALDKRQRIEARECRRPALTVKRSPCRNTSPAMPCVWKSEANTKPNAIRPENFITESGNTLLRQCR